MAVSTAPGGQARPTVAGIGASGSGTVLDVAGLTKTFGKATVVEDLSFDLRRGEVMGFLGPNGAGKSTTVGMILGLVTPTKGTVRIAGKQLDGERGLVADNIGAIIESPAFYPHLSGRDNLRALAIMAGRRDDKQIHRLLELVNMADRADKPYKTFSLGMKQRIAIAATLVTNPSIVILDEPTNGLDPAGQREIREIIPRLAQEGHAVLLASHLLHEVEQVSDRVTIIQKGRFVRAGRVDDLLRAGSAIEVTLHDDAEAERAAEVVRGLRFVQKVDRAANALHVSAPLESSGAVNQALAQAGIFASQVSHRRNTLEDLFLELTDPDTAAV